MLKPVSLRFHTSSTIISFEELLDEVIAYIQVKSKKNYSVMIGSDSRATRKSEIVTAIALWRIGNGGRYFWMKSKEETYPTLRDRIYKETMQSITLAQELKSALRDRVGEEFFWNNQLVVHIDVGENGPTKELKESVLGMAKGFGLDAVIKPFAVAASVIADRHT